MSYETIQIARNPQGIATLTLNRPEKHNVLNAAMIADLTDAAAVLGADEAVRAVVLTGAGKSFCAGGDLTWMRAQIEADRATRMAEARKLAHMLGALNTLPKPLIARVNGQAYGGGVGMISVCDVAIADDAARFGLTETRLGLIPATIGPYVLAKLGLPRAREVFFSSRRFDAAEALRLGLIARAVPAEVLDAAVAAETAPYLETAPGAVAAAKALLIRLARPVDAAAIEATATALADQWETEEAEAGIAAFFAKRPPPWQLG